MSKEARAAAAKALDEYCRRGVWGSGASKLSTDEANAAIDAYLAALAGTHVMAPREPTEAMCKAGMAAEFGEVRVAGIKHAEVKLGPPGAARVYRAMLSASNREPERDQRTDRDDSQD